MAAPLLIQEAIGRTPALVWVLLLMGLMTGTMKVRGQTFAPPQVLYAGLGEPVFADMDNDDLVDLLMVRSDTLFVVGNSGGSFIPPTALVPLGPAVSLRKVADLDADGAQDIIVSKTIYLEGVGERDSIGIIWLSPTAETVWLDTGRYVSSIRVADMNNDELPELVFRGQFDTDIVVHTNNGDRDFQRNTYPNVGSNGGVVLGFFDPYDWDGDGDMDLMGGIGLNSYTAVSYNVGGALGYPFVEVHNGTNVPAQSDVIDLDADGNLDFIAANHAYLRSAAGTMDIRCCFANGVAEREMGNLDCDPALEIIAPIYTGELDIWDLSVAGFVQRRVTFLESGDQFEMSVVDLNNDGLSDIAYRVQQAFTYDTLFYRLNITTEPAVTLELPTDVLAGDAVIPLTGGTPEGGLYSGPGVYDNTLYVALANQNDLNISYTYSDPLTTCMGQASAMVQTAVGMSERTAEDRSLLYPNPATTSIFYRPSFNGTAQLRILDTTGRVLSEKPTTAMDGNAMELSIADLSPGWYNLQVLDQAGQRKNFSFLRSGGDH